MSRPADPRTLPERCTTRAKPNFRSFYLEVGNLEPQDAQVLSRAHPVRPTRTFFSSSRQALFERSKPLLVRQALWRFSRHLPRALASRARDLQPGVKARCSSARARGAGARREVLFGASRRGRGREARRGFQPGDVRSFLRHAAAGEGAEANYLQPGEVFGACRRGRRRGGLGLYQLQAARGATGLLRKWHLARAVGKRFRGAVQSTYMFSTPSA